VDFEARYRWHFLLLHRRLSQNAALHADVVDYSGCAFRFVVLQELDLTVPFAPFEQFWIDYLTSLGVKCYNVMRAVRCPLRRDFPESAPDGYEYTLADVTNYAGLSAVSVRQGIVDGTFQGFRTRAGWRFTAEQVETIREVWRERRAWNKHRRHTRRLDASIA
jgi:hypothetical protein